MPARAAASTPSGQRGHPAQTPFKADLAEKAPPTRTRRRQDACGHALFCRHVLRGGGLTVCPDRWRGHSGYPGEQGQRAARARRAEGPGLRITRHPAPGSEGIPLPAPLPKCLDTVLPPRAQDGGLARGCFQGARLQVPSSCQGGGHVACADVGGVSSFGHRSCSVVPKEGRGRGLALGPWLPPYLARLPVSPRTLRAQRQISLRHGTGGFLKPHPDPVPHPCTPAPKEKVNRTWGHGKERGPWDLLHPQEPLCGTEVERR